MRPKRAQARNEGLSNIFQAPLEAVSSFRSNSPVLVLRPQSRLERPGAPLAEAAVAVGGPDGGVGDVGEGAAVVLVAVVTQSADEIKVEVVGMNLRQLEGPNSK